MRSTMFAAFFCLFVIGLVACDVAYEPASAGAATPPAVIDTTAASAGPASSITPQETVRAMLALAEQGDWIAYVEQYYGEKHKFRPGQNDLEKVADRLAQRSDMMVEHLRRIAEMEPEMIDGGAKARYDMGDEKFFTLYRTEDGRWTFHL